MAGFLISCQISQAEANTKEGSLIAPLDDDDILTAITDFDAHLNVEWPLNVPSK